MEIGSLLNQNVDVLLEDDGKTVKLINSINNMELARFNSDSVINCWGNPGGFMTMEQYDKYMEKINAETV